MQKTKLLEDLSILSGVAITNLDKLTSLEEDIIGHAVLEAVTNKDPIAEIDIGIGVLYILISDDEIKYKFIPSSKVQNSVKLAVDKRQSKLTQRVDETLARRIMHTYKDLF